MVSRTLKKMINDPGKDLPHVEPGEKKAIDLSPRGHALRRVEGMKYYILRRHRWTDTIPEANPTMEEMSRTFEYLDEYYIAPHAAARQSG
jgi:hypothetical protein